MVCRQDVYDAMVYENLMPLYFPRAASEEHEAAKLLPLVHRPPTSKPAMNTGLHADHAEPHNSRGLLYSSLHATDCEPNPALTSVTRAPRAGGAGGSRPGETSAAAALHAAAASTSISDDAMLNGSAYAAFLQRARLPSSPPLATWHALLTPLPLVPRGRYAAFLQRAGLADLSDIESMQLFYRGGVDARGRPIFLFWAGHLPSRPVDLERVLMHLMRTPLPSSLPVGACHALLTSLGATCHALLTTRVLVSRHGRFPHLSLRRVCNRHPRRPRTL